MDDARVLALGAFGEPSGPRLRKELVERCPVDRAAIHTEAE